MELHEGTKLLQDAADLQGKILEAQEHCREIFIEQESEKHFALRVMVDGLIARLARQLGKEVQATDAEISYQLTIGASFIRSHFLINDLAMTGHVVEALILVRKQLESFARLCELDSATVLKLEKKVPHIGRVMKQAGRLYGELSEVAHFSTPRVGELLHIMKDGSLAGASLSPVFTESCFGCIDRSQFVALNFLGWIVGKFPTWYPSYNIEDDEALLAGAFSLALEIYVVRLPESE
jgi:hypothetical protein